MPRTGHIALAGAPNVGKSSLLNALVGQHLAIVSPRAQATRLPVTGIRTEGDTQYVFHDLPGLLDPAYLMQARMRSSRSRRSRAWTWCCISTPRPMRPAPAFNAPGPARPPARGAGAHGLHQGRSASPARRRAELERSALVVSATDGEGTRRACSPRVREQLPEREFAYDPDDVGTQPVRFFVVEYLREAAFELLEDELPYGFTAEVEEFREAERPVYIRVTLFVERESQKGIVIGAGGATIKAIGAHARRRIEELIGAPVYLDCWVKVLPHWRKSAAALTRFGFPESETP